MQSFKMILRSLLVAGLVGATGLGISGCQGGTAPQVGKVAPAISCTDVRGELVDLNKLRNQAVLVYFWSSKCCGEKLKQLEPFYQENKYNGLSIIAIEVGGAKQAVAAFARKNNFHFTVIADEDGSISRSYQVIGFPTILVVDKKGVFRKKILGEIPNDQLAQAVAPFL